MSEQQLSSTAVPALECLVSAKRIFRMVKSIEITKAEIKCLSSKSTDEKSYALVLVTKQDDRHPIHVLECHYVEGGFLKVKSLQYSKSLPRQSHETRIIRVMMPTHIEKGVRKDLKTLMQTLATDRRLRRKLNVKRVEIVKDTVKDSEWLISLS
ncbi:hypothetical protein E4U30_007178 [Claviceps sp. LM220 group G6]|nr:hypothetical protein E4U15_004346 [Claviceps sp. LM218 group G6]KAG6099038.1 hypothetical protein E4U30_007178 [Claviceps sp. LM220 group G6]KAG6107174.1 hypothetical protein E4U14_004297 [Claviceps sp. LM454 group G7]KAG6113881.1 hypothetical protein E4U31_007651 [Claviceps sp. LM219 group G6]